MLVKPTYREIGQALRDSANTQGITVTDIAAKANVTPQRIHQMFRGDGGGINSQARLAEILGLKMRVQINLVEAPKASCHRGIWKQSELRWLEAKVGTMSTFQMAEELGRHRLSIYQRLKLRGLAHKIIANRYGAVYDDIPNKMTYTTFANKLRDSRIRKWKDGNKGGWWVLHPTEAAWVRAGGLRQYAENDWALLDKMKEKE